MNEDHSSPQDTSPRDENLPELEPDVEAEASTPAKHSRIEELEAQVRELSGLVEVLMERPERRKVPRPRGRKNDPAAAPDKELPKQMELGDGADAHDLVDDVREGMERMLSMRQGETLESRIGSTWLPRIAVVLFMTLLVLGIRDDSIEVAYKVASGYLVSTGFVAFGLWRLRNSTLFSKALLGTGLATFYFTTYGAFFIPGTQLVENSAWAIPSTLIVLGTVALVLFKARSETTTSIMLVLTYYTVVLSLNQEIDNQAVVYAFATCSLVTAMTMFLQFFHAKMLVSWISLVASLSIYCYFFVYSPPYLDMPASRFQLYSMAFLTIVFLANSIACIGFLRQCLPDNKNVLYFAGLNIVTFLLLTWYPLKDYFQDFESEYRAILAITMIALTAISQRYCTKNNSVMQMFLCTALMFATLALYTAMAIEWGLIGFAIECLVLALVYRHFSLTVLKTLHVLLLVSIFAGSMWILNLPDTIVILDYAIPEKWFTCVSVVTLFALIAWYYDHRVAVYSTNLYQQESHWFLANRRLNWSPNVMAVMNTTAGALLLTALTIVDLATEPALPFVLAGEGLLFALVGLVMRIPQMQLSAVLIVASSHVTYHFFWMTDKEGFMTQPSFVAMSVTLALVSFLASYFWERYIRRIEDGTPWEHDLLASIPFIASTLVLTTLFERIELTGQSSLGQTTLGLLLMGVGTYSLMMGIRLAAITAIFLGCASFYVRSLDVLSPNATHPYFAAILIGLIVSVALSERLLQRWETKIGTQSRLAQLMHILLISIVVLYGILGFYHWANPDRFSLHLMAFGVCMLAFGVMCRSAQYRIGALFVIFCVFVRLYLYDLSNLAPFLKLVVFGIITATIFLISWGYARRTVQRRDE